jgi:sporulation protein YunB
MFSMDVITDTINESVADNINMDDLLMMQKNASGMSKSVVVNTGQVNHIMAVVGKSLEKGVKEIENSDDWEQVRIPLGILISCTVVSDMGPKVKINIRPIGSYKVDLISQVKGYGINNSLVEVYLLVTIEMEALIPLRILPVTTESKIYLVSQIIKGEIPNYYYAAGTYLPNPPRSEADFGNIPH